MHRLRSALAAALVAPLLVLVAASGGATGPTTGPVAASAREPAPYDVDRFRLRADDDPRLQRAWRTWRGRDHQRYSTVVLRGCFCLEQKAVRTTVRRGEVTSVAYDGGRELRRPGYEMDALYRLLRRAHREAAVLEVRYRRGVPVSVYVDADRRIADEEYSLRVRVTDTDPPETFAYAVEPFRPTADDDAALRRAWQDWRGSAIRSYRTTVTRQAGEGTFPTVVTEVDGPVVREVGVTDPGAEAPRRGHEVERLYRQVRRLHATADEVEVRYDARGVPRRIAADPVAGAVDDELVLRVRLRAS